MTTPESSGNADIEAEQIASLEAGVGVFSQQGDYWTLGLDRSTFPLKDVKGLAFIQHLLQHPHREFHALDLLGKASLDPTSKDAIVGREEALPVGVTIRPGLTGDAGEMLDAQAKREYKRRWHELKEAVEDQRERGNHERADQMETEIDFLEREIERATGMGGRDRRTGSNAERARLSVTRAIRTALQKINEQQTALGELLDRCIRTGTFCSYVPDFKHQVTWKFSTGNSAVVREVPAIKPSRALGNTSFLRSFTQGTVFVGREAERAMLSSALDQTLGGEGKVVLIGGGAGVGKTRIAAEISTQAARRGMLTFVGACYDRDEPVPFVPFVEIFEAALAQTRDQAALRNALGGDASEIARLVPQLRRAFPDISAPAELSPEQSRRALFNAVTEVVVRVSQDTPSLFLFDDLQWADEGTLLLLSHLARFISQLPVMIVGTFRDFELDRAGHLNRTLDELIRSHLVERFTLPGLPQAAVAQMLRGLSGREAPEAVVRLFHAYTEGNPFFVEELFKHLVEQGRLIDSDGEFRDNPKLNELEVPQSLRVVIGRRVARLTDDTQRALGTAAVIGRSFTFDLLRASTLSDADSLLDYLEEAEGAGLIASTLEYPEARFRFSHELIRQAVIGGLSHARQQRLHLKVADAVEQLYPDALEDHAEDLAYHLRHAGAAADSGRTIRYLKIAGERAVQRSANLEAISHFKNALELVKIIHETPDLLRQELQLQTALATALFATKGFSSHEVEAVCARARDLSHRIGEADHLFRALWGLWLNYASRAQYRAALELGEQCLQLAQSSQDPALLIEAHHALGVSRNTTGEFRRGLEHLERAVALYVPERHASHAYLYGQDPGAICLIHAGFSLWFLGYPDQALSKNAEGLALARKLPHPSSLATATAFAAWTEQLCRNAEAVEELAEVAVAISTEHNLAFNKGIGVGLRGWALIERGQQELGIAGMRQGLDTLRAADAVIMISYFSALLAEAYGEMGNAEEGLNVLAGVENTRERYWEAELHRVKGELILKRNVPKSSSRSDQAAAESYFHQALEAARAQEAKSLELRAATSISRLWMKQDRYAEARTLMTETIAWFTEGFSTPDLQEARLLLEDLERGGV